MRYRTGLVLGRAYALAHAPSARDERSARELCQLAAGDRAVLELADEICRERLAEDPDDALRCQACALLAQAMEALDGGRVPLGAGARPEGLLGVG